MRARRPVDAVGDVVLLVFGLILVAGAIGTLAERSGWWTVLAVIELIIGAAFLMPRRRVR